MTSRDNKNLNKGNIMTSHKIRIPQFVKLMVRKCYEKDLTPEEISKKLGITLSKVNFILDK